MNEITTILLPLLAGAVAGISWSMLGVWSKYRSGGEKSLDGSKLRKNLAVGAGTGFASYIYAIATNTSIPSIDSFAGFVAAAGAYFVLVVLVDKLLVAKEDPIDDEDD